MGRRLGQHFLYDPVILGRIADAAALSPSDHVLEIGPGRGTLTAALAGRAGRVTCIEADRELAADLVASPPAPNVTVVSGDALQVSWPRADVIAGNIPYQITSPLIERALAPPRPRRIVFLVQREVAERLAAQPGTAQYGALTVGVRLVAEVERVFIVRAGAFVPPPKVDSALVRITPRSSPLCTESEEPAVRAVIQRVFQRRRQQLQRALREAYGLASDVVEDLLRRNHIAPAARPETLAPESFVALARALRSV
ncbi:MAG TPA: 16S rRNA (adenine(1518)-N(6)/adenine(1519)-N(6))-dimethyltransferase RsmA [Gemmatimonadales bacterium]|nr:16S rRNA (adenine(1518)-N(6)/adenine(1519)-N(6))-dimethyltransferase RsmA [Gemmatimonadales bacterium]